MLVKSFKWPVVSLLITGGFHFVIEASLPGLKDFFVPPVLAVILISYGIWVGYKTIDNAGNYVLAIIAGVILGLLPLMLDTIGFGLILGRGLEWGTLAGMFGFSMIVFGSLIGSGFALSSHRAGV